jgi:3-methyladenine DNA glycosylase AlkD
MADKKAANVVFETFLPIIKREANDDRLYVRKAVNWALRSIGKRNIDLNVKAIQMAHEIVVLNSKAAKWIGKDAIRKLELDTVNILNYPRSLYS